MLMLIETNHTVTQKVKDLLHFFQEKCTISNCNCLPVFSEGIGSLFNYYKS
jgi:hypothetical protein